MSTEIVNINKTFRKKEVLRGISFSAERGTCTGIIGRNGSGKSTLLSILAGVQRCDSGDLIFEGKSLFSDRKALSSTVGYVPQGTPLIEELSAYDNLLLWYDRDELTKELQSGVLFMLGINEFLKTPVFKMSGGMKKRLSIGCSVFRKPPVLLLDEPSAALDIICKESIASYIESYKKSGGTVIITTHDEREIALCDRLFILKDGLLSGFTYDGDIRRLSENI